jgi:uncharacterized RDD family membrane protein YckC
MLEEKYNTFSPRFWAGFIDGLIFIPLDIADYFISEYHTIISDTVIIFWFILSSMAFMIYSVLMHGIYGQTVGKMAMRVKVLDISENKLSMLQALKRDLIPIILICIGIVMELTQRINIENANDSLNAYNIATNLVTYIGIVWFMAEIVTMLFNNQRRALHDFIAGSVVIKEIQQHNPADR